MYYFEIVSSHKDANIILVCMYVAGNLALDIPFPAVPQRVAPNSEKC